jgi:hypothetical protein
VKVVSETPEADLERARKERERADALHGVQCALVDLTANLLRVVRGAGKSYAIPRDAIELFGKIRVYTELTNELPHGYDLEQVLSMRRAEDWETLEEEIRKWDPVKEAEASIVAGSLQIAASRLLGQHTQERAGCREMLEGIEELREARKAEAAKPQKSIAEALEMLKTKKQQRKDPAVRNPRKKS